MIHRIYMLLHKKTEEKSSIDLNHWIVALHRSQLDKKKLECWRCLVLHHAICCNNLKVVSGCYELTRDVQLKV